MNTFKILSTTCMFLALTCTAQAQNIAEKTLVKSFNLQGSQEVLLDLKGDVDVQEWNNDIMRVQITIGIPNGNEAMLKSLVRAGRYNLRSKTNDEDAYLVFAPGLDREIKLKGQPLKEILSYQIFAPSNVIVKQTTEASTSNVKVDKKSSSM